MNSVNNVSGIAQQLGLTPATNQVGEKSLGQQDFLKILMAQLQHQDPFESQDNGDFIAQMAQFGTVDGIGRLEQSFSSLSNSLYSNQALQASALVGRSVEIPSEHAHLEAGKNFEGALMLDSDLMDVTVKIADASGKTVKTLNLGTQTAGHHSFRWDGTDTNGAPAPSGTYTISADGQLNGQRFACNTLAKANVNSVILGQNGQGLKLNLQGMGNVDFNDIVKIV